MMMPMRAGRAQVYTGRSALKAGLIDEVGTMDAVLRRDFGEVR